MTRILYIEDSKTSQVLMQRHLAGLGTLVLLDGPKEAFRKIEEEAFDLVIADFLFPGGDAIDVINRIRQRYTVDQLPIVVVSGSMDAPMLSRVLAAGANEGVAKPLNAVTFRTLVERMLTSPYVHDGQRVILNIVCFQWKRQGVFYEYCPEAQLTVSGLTAAEASERMATQLRALHEKGTSFGITEREKVVSHLVETAASIAHAAQAERHLP